MVSIMRGVFIARRYQWLASVTTGFYLFCCVPQSGFSLVEDASIVNGHIGEALDQAEIRNVDAVTVQFDQLEKTIQISQNPLEEGRRFLESFVAEVNARYNLNLTLLDACKLVRENLHTLQLPAEAQKTLLATIELMEFDPTTISSNQSPNESQTVAVPSAYIEWNLFEYLFSPKKKSSKHKPVAPRPTLTAQTASMKELPGNCYAGGCELLAGALVAIIPLPGAFWLGCMVMGDGVRRISDGVLQLSDERRADPNYVPSKPPF